MRKECIVLAGGLGTRLQSAVANTPKCLAPIGTQPFLFFLCKQLVSAGFTDIIFSVGYLKEQVIDWVEVHKKELEFTPHYAVEETQLGTGGGIKNALQLATNKNVLIVNGDTYFAINIENLYQQHLQHNATITLAIKPMQHFDRYGTVIVNTENKIIAFEEKKEKEQGLINGGIYLLNKDAFLAMNFPTIFSFEKDYVEKYLSDLQIYAMPSNGYFIDIGIPQDYAKAQAELPNISANTITS